MCRCPVPQTGSACHIDCPRLLLAGHAAPGIPLSGSEAACPFGPCASGMIGLGDNRNITNTVVIKHIAEAHQNDPRLQALKTALQETYKWSCTSMCAGDPSTPAESSKGSFVCWVLTYSMCIHGNRNRALPPAYLSHLRPQRDCGKHAAYAPPRSSPLRSGTVVSDLFYLRPVSGD